MRLLEGVQDDAGIDDLSGDLKRRPGRGLTGPTRRRRSGCLLRQGTKRFGNPDAATVAALEAIKDIDRLEALGELILDTDVHNWAELLQIS